MAEPAPAVDEVLAPDISHLVTEDDTPVDNIFSEKQQRLLTETLYTSWDESRGRTQPFLAVANVGLFASPKQDPLVPDMLLSLDVEWRPEPDEVLAKRHRSYLVWEFGKPPDVVVEVVSNRQGGEEAKGPRYAAMGVAYYAIFDPDGFLSERPLRVWQRHGPSYVEMLDPSRLPGTGLGLVLWEGEYAGTRATWLRWRDGRGLLPTGAEARQEAERGRQEAERAREKERQARQEAEARAARLAARLREMGVEEE